MRFEGEEVELMIKHVLKAPATVTVTQCHVAHVTTWNAWELADAQGTVGKRAASCLEVTGSAAK